MSKFKKGGFFRAREQIGIDEARIDRFSSTIPFSVSFGHLRFLSHELYGIVPDQQQAILYSLVRV